LFVTIELEPNPLGLPTELMSTMYLRRVSDELLSRLVDPRVQRSLFSGWHGTVKVSLDASGSGGDSITYLDHLKVAPSTRLSVADTSNAVLNGRVVPIRS
jgi:hypothetical protein